MLQNRCVMPSQNVSRPGFRYLFYPDYFVLRRGRFSLQVHHGVIQACTLTKFHPNNHLSTILGKGITYPETNHWVRSFQIGCDVTKRL